MRQSDTSCTGSCHLHGDWKIEVQAIGCGAPVNDRCPYCVQLENEVAFEERVEIATDDAFADGYDSGLKEALDAG